MGRNTEMVESSALDSLVIIVRNPNENSDVIALLEIEYDTGALDCFP